MPPIEEIVRELQDAVQLTPVHPIDTWIRSSRERIIAPAAVSRSAGSFFSLLPWLIGAGIVVAGLLYVSQYGLHLKARVIQQGDAAIGHLLNAKDDLERMDFTAAQDDFSQALERFDRAHGELGIIGTGLGDILANLPGGRRIRTAQDIIEAGRLLSEAGSSLAKAIGAFASSGGLLNPLSDNRTSFGQVLLPMQEALTLADQSIGKADALLAGIDPAVLPDDSRERYRSFVSRLPEIRQLVEQAGGAASFFGRFAGTDHPRRYILLFQNSSELRPTGGFPGSYGLATFEDGRLRNISTDDIYNPDGQIRELIIPPVQLQHITPSWGMRDANWFVDFPTSARKVAELYRKGGGAAVDGIIAMRPEVLAEMLKITGPISLPQYDLVLTAENFLPTVQLQVESIKSSKEPKRIIMDLAPLVLAKLSALPPQQWARALDVFRDALSARDMLMYFTDDQLQRYAIGQGWDGGIKNPPGDYLNVNIANIKGAKADAVTSTTEKLESWLQDGAMVHRLTLTRQHNGGHSEYGFYNKTNYSYVRVLVPDGSTLRGISGNDHPANQSMLDYVSAHATTDPDLAALEATYRYDPIQGVTTFRESGKTGFGFWMRIEPGQTSAVQIEYVVPAGAAASNYRLYVQRQPGLDLSDFEFTFQRGGAAQAVSASVPLTEWPDSWRLHDPLRHDLELTVNLDG